MCKLKAPPLPACCCDQGANGASSADRIRARGGGGGHKAASEHICLIHYLTDVDERTPSFCVVPHSHRIPAIDLPGRGVPNEVLTALAGRGRHLPLYGRAGTAILYDISLCATIYP